MTWGQFFVGWAVLIVVFVAAWALVVPRLLRNPPYERPQEDSAEDEEKRAS